MQQAYVSEAVAIGNWTIIGYKGPGDETTAGSATGGTVSKTTNFTFSDASGFEDNTVAISDGAVGFTATSNAKLNDCEMNSTWTISVGEGSSAGEASFTPGGAGITDQACVALTPNYKTLGK